MGFRPVPNTGRIRLTSLNPSSDAMHDILNFTQNRKHLLVGEAAVRHQAEKVPYEFLCPFSHGLLIGPYPFLSSALGARQERPICAQQK